MEPSNPATAGNAAASLARLAVRVLAEESVAHVLLCPGSRSAPLAYELAAAEAVGGPRVHIRHDERVAAFIALGAGGAVVTTSGTAVANLHPAVLEAHHSGRPLVVVTADRPPSLRGTWANQTSELQAGLFGGALRARLDLADTDAAADPRAAMAAVVATVRAAFGDASRRPGPVHLNLGFGEPLLPDDEESPDDGSPDGVGLPDGGRVRRVAVRRNVSRPGPADSPITVEQGLRTVVLAGDGAGDAARHVAEAAGWPLLAEPSSGARGGPNAVGPYRLLLDLPDLGGAVERVVVFGRPTLSRPVTRLIGRPEVEVVLVSGYGDWPDPGRPVTRGTRVVLAGDPPGASPGTSPAGWPALWREAGAAAASAVDAVLDSRAASGHLSGPFLARELAAALRPGERLVAAASNPVRDLDLAAHPATGPTSLPIVANRGLAGIDGTISTATGLAHRSGSVRVLIGDVAFLHDVGALLATPGDPRPDLQIVVLNDAGGGIFSLLEHGEVALRSDAAAARFDRLFGTPHTADLAALAAGYGVRHDLVRDAADLRELLASPPSGTSVVEVPCDRAGLRDLHALLRSAVGSAVAAADVPSVVSRTAPARPSSPRPGEWPPFPSGPRGA
ncbi:MAG: 2-succinyl-5-enolpyruvyl-6-hydroxy-3-cyclohexene-carboxylate synthase [Actinomycetota bacterium]|nr:2-succinyl-5-enolpyruvyl-6-hydroxy-3-cyclohexene-carboxylate synthase [Actinomycetota bacterium]